MNPHVLQRLAGIYQTLMGAYASSSSMSSATRGYERQAFIDGFLSKVFPSHWRFGTGDATDKTGARSGQLDVVIEYPFIPSLPIVGVEKSRLYLAEGISAVIEVKSDVSSQWSEVESTARQLATLTRSYGSGVSFGPMAPPKIPYFVVGFKGWKDVETVKKKIRPGLIDGVLVLDGQLYAGPCGSGGGTLATMWMFISDLHQAASMQGTTATDVPLEYVI